MERIVLGTLLNDDGSLYSSCRMSLRKELFSERRNAFVFGIISDMHDNGHDSTTPLDMLEYANEHSVKYGDTARFCDYICTLSMNYAHKSFKRHVRDLVKIYLKELYGKR